MKMGGDVGASSGRRNPGPAWPVFGSVLLGLFFVMAGIGIMKTLM